MKKLGFALTTQEIDVLINICGSNGSLRWRDFLKMIELRYFFNLSILCITSHILLNRDTD